MRQRSSSNMFLLKILLITALAKLSHGYCIPCPHDNISVRSFIDCDCPLGEFYHDTEMKCVDYSNCPRFPMRNPIPELRALSPALFDTVSNSLESSGPWQVKWPKDVTMFVDVMNERVEALKRMLPATMAPIVAPVVLKNKDILQQCQGKAMCVMLEALKKQESYQELLPKLKPVMAVLSGEVWRVLDELEKRGKDCNYKNNCPLVRAIIDIKTHLPGAGKNLKNAPALISELGKYMFSDMETYLPFFKH